MTSTIYRRQSMATLYEKLRAQDGEDHMAWLAEVTAEFDTDDKPEHFVSFVPSPPSAISSGSSSSTSSPQNTISSLDSHDQSDGDYESDSDSDSEIEPIHNSDGILFQPCDAIQYPGSDFLAHNLSQEADFPYIPPVECDPPASLGHTTSQITLPTEDVPSPLPPLAPLPAPHAMSPLQFVTRSTRSLSKLNTSAVLHDLDEDAEGSSDAEESDDEYVPSPFISNPRKRRRSSRNTSVPAVGSSNRHVSSSTKRPRPAPPPRNVQAVSGITPTPTNKSSPWACPYCTWVQRNHRTPDLKRHIRTHTRFERPAQWVCCGVPFESAAIYNVPHGATPYVRDGEQWIGGCGKEFSRRDALKRHLGNDHISCIGDIYAFANVSDD